MLYIAFCRSTLQGLRISVCSRQHRYLCSDINIFADVATDNRNNRNHYIFKLLKIVVFSIVIVSLISADSYCCAKNVDTYDDLYYTSGADDLNDALNDNDRNLLEEFNLSIDNPDSLADFNGFDLFKRLIQESIDNVDSPIFAVATLCTMLLIYAVVYTTLPDKKDNMVLYVLPCACIATVIIPIIQLISDAAESVSACCIFMQSFIPIYAGVLITAGKSATSGTYSTLMFAVSQVICSISDRLLIPICSAMIISSIGSVFNEMSTKINCFLKKSAITVITLGMTIFTFLLGLQTSISSASDSVGLKAAKTAIGTFVPIVGSSISESLSVVIGSVSLFKSSVGLYSMICLVIMLVPSVVGVMVWKLALSAVSLLSQAVGSNETEKLISMLNGVLTVILSVLLCTALVYIVSIALTLSVGG